MINAKKHLLDRLHNGIKMNKISLLLGSLFIACSASASVINTSQYEVSGLSGYWAAGSTGWNLYPAAVTVASADVLMSDGYTDDFGHSVINGIYSGYPSSPSSITFSTVGGNDFLLNTFSFITSRNYSNSTVLSLEYSLNGGAWLNAEIVSTSFLLAPLSSCLAAMNNNCAGMTATMNFGGVMADQWRLTLSGDQVSLHEVVVDGGAASSVPEPSSLALLGLGLASLAGLRRKKK